jgi:hypothetical protein
MAEASFTIRAIDATRQAFGEIQNSLAKLKSSSQTAAAFMKKVFDPRALGTGLAAAFGISLVGAIDAAVDALGRMMTRMREMKRIEQETASEVAKIYQDAERKLMGPEKLLGELTKDRLAIEQQIAKLREETASTMVEVRTPTLGMGPGVGSSKVMQEVRKGTAEDMKALNERSRALADLNVQIAELQRTIESSRAAETITAETERIKAQAQAYGELERKAQASFDALIAGQRRANDEAERQRELANRTKAQLEETASAQLDLLDPTRQYKRELELVKKLELEMLLTADQAAQRRAQINAEMAAAAGNIVEQQAEAVTEMTRMRDLAQDVGDTIAGGFEDAIFSGEKLSEVLKRLALDLMRLLFQRMVTQQLAAGITTMLGFPALPGRANGGSVNANSAYMVGERGPELFVPGTSGAIIPNNRMGSGGGGGGPTVNISYNIQSGVSRAELQPILEQERKRLRAEIPDMVRRGGSYRAAFA